MTQPIVVGLDGSAGDEDAIRQPAFEARARRRPVRLVHALETPYRSASSRTSRTGPCSP
ncbi:universal stress protein [Carbonactinospora thermoautotrophica]|uniref:universal stress protein n=1 Tax=Carbonactinospora thermoautotrophica TaxID=1469144 RepID=UPI001300EF3F|nr:universal stress protein [Carbonactinospora thermoautotrophica]